MSALKAVILDIDGTLVSSNDQHARAFLEAAEELAFVVPSFEQVRRLIGMGGDKLIPAVFGFKQDSERGKALEEAKGRIFREKYLPRLRPTPGARALLERMRSEGLQLVVATSANEEDLHGLLNRAGVADLIEDSTSAGDVEKSKPDPDVVHAALRQAGAAPEAVLMIGDTPYDVEAAGRARVRIIALRSGGWSDEDLRGAIAIFDDPADLLSKYGGTPMGARESRTS